MSYILDALRKSEQERMRGKLPDLKNFGEEDKPSHTGHRWVWILGGALLLTNAVGLGIWLNRSDSATSTAAAVEKVTIDKKPVGKEPVDKEPVRSSEPALDRSASVVTQPSTGAIAPNAATPVSQMVTPQVNTQPGNQAATNPAAGAPANVPPGTVYYVTSGVQIPGQQIVVVPATGAVAPAGNVVVQVPPQTTPAWSTQGTVVQPPPPVPPPPTPVNLDQALDATGASAPTPNVNYLPQLDELPDYLRAQIPDMTFSSHMYSSMARFRSVVINGTRVKEGQMVGNNIQVNEITETGVILSVGGTLFQVDVLGKWSQ